MTWNLDKVFEQLSLRSTGPKRQLTLSELEQCRQHGLLFFFQDQLSSTSQSDQFDSFNQLKQALADQIKMNLMLMRALGLINQSFQAMSNGMLCYKGPVLSYYLYGNISCRSYCDLDILVWPERLPSTIKQLADLGYNCKSRIIDLESYPTLATLGGLQFFNSQLNVTLEVHAHIAEHRYTGKLRAETFLQEATPVEVFGQRFFIPEPAALMVALCVHGTKHFWQKLLWLHDVYVLLQTKPIDLSRVWAIAEEGRVTYALNSAASMLRHFYGDINLSAWNTRPPVRALSLVQHAVMQRKMNQSKIFELVLLSSCFKSWSEYALFTKRSLLCPTARDLEFSGVAPTVTRVIRLCTQTASELLIDAGTLLEALSTICFWSVRVRLKSKGLIGPRLMKHSGREDPGEASKIVRQVSGIARRLPWQPNCLVQALSVNSMLNRRNISNCIRLEASRADREFRAHAWIQVGNSSFLKSPETLGFHQFN